MVVAFGSDAAIAEASVEVSEDISITAFSRRMESLLDCGAKSEGLEWVMKFACRMSEYGTADEVRRLLCDKIASIDGLTGETIGVLKIKRRSVNAGHAKIRLVPNEDSLQLVVRHSSAQGLKAVWKSVLWRLKPQHGTPGAPGNEEEWQKFRELCERQGWDDPDQEQRYGGNYCDVYANGVDMQMSCPDGTLPQIGRKFRGEGNGQNCNWNQLRAKLNGRKFKIVTSRGNLWLKF